MATGMSREHERALTMKLGFRYFVETQARVPRHLQLPPGCPILYAEDDTPGREVYEEVYALWGTAPAILLLLRSGDRFSALMLHPNGSQEITPEDFGVGTADTMDVVYDRTLRPRQASPSDDSRYQVSEFAAV